MKKRRRKKKRFPVYRKVGYSFVGVYAVTAVILVTFLIGLDMIPMPILGVLAGVLAVLCLLFIVMQKRRAISVIADILCFALVVGSIAAAFYIDKMDNTIRDVAAVPKEQMETVEIGVYVLEEDPAQTLQDAADYEFGIVSPGGQETAQAIEDIEGRAGKGTGNGRI